MSTQLEAELQTTRNALTALRRDVDKARDAVVEQLYRNGYDRESVNDFIDGVNGKTRFIRWEKEAGEFNATVRFEITIEVEGIELEDKTLEEVESDDSVAAKLVCSHLGIDSLDDFDIRYMVDYDPYVADADVTDVNG